MKHLELILFRPHKKNSRLTTRVEPKDYSSPEKRNELAELLKFNCSAYRGLGIAANQLGLDERVFYSNGKAYFNPEIVSQPEEGDANAIVPFTEGCLSFLGTPGNTRRFNWVEVSYMDQEGNEVQEMLRDTDAIVFQHEIDHLNGFTMVDRIASKVLRDKFFKKYSKKLSKN